MHVGMAKPSVCNPGTRCEPYGSQFSGLAQPTVCTPEANPMVHAQFRLVKLRFCIPRTRCDTQGAHAICVGKIRDANPMVHAHCGLARPDVCIPTTTCEHSGGHSFWVREATVLHSQNEMRTLWCTLVLCCRNLIFAFPERDAKRMVQNPSGLAKPKFPIPRKTCEFYCAQSFSVGGT